MLGQKSTAEKGKRAMATHEGKWRFDEFSLGRCGECLRARGFLASHGSSSASDMSRCVLDDERFQ